MSRPQSRVRMGYFPLPDAAARRIRQHVGFPTSSFTALDPCAGEGRALAVITEGTRGQSCGIELDAYRAEEAKQRLDQVIYGDCFDVECKVESGAVATHAPSATYNHTTALSTSPHRTCFRILSMAASMRNNTAN